MTIKYIKNLQNKTKKIVGEKNMLYNEGQVASLVTTTSFRGFDSVRNVLTYSSMYKFHCEIHRGLHCEI